MERRLCAWERIQLFRVSSEWYVVDTWGSTVRGRVCLRLCWPKRHKKLSSALAARITDALLLSSLVFSMISVPTFVLVCKHGTPRVTLRYPKQGTHGNRAAADRSRTTGWGWPGGGSGAAPVDPGDYDTVEANASMAMLPAIPCRHVSCTARVRVVHRQPLTALLEVHQ